MVGKVSVFIPSDTCSPERSFAGNRNHPVERVVPKYLRKVIIGTDIVLIMFDIDKVNLFISHRFLLPIHDHLFNRSQIS